jgi:hypothetical protein
VAQLYNIYHGNERNDDAEERRRETADRQNAAYWSAVELTNTWTGESLGRANSPTEGAALRAKLSGAKNTTDRVTSLIQETEELSRIKGPGVAMSQLWVGENSKYGMILKDYLLEMSGRAATDAEVKQIMTYILPPPAAWLGKDPTAAYNQFNSFLLSKVRDQLAGQKNAKQLPEVPLESADKLKAAGKLRD